MKNRTLLRAGIVGTLAAAVCCFTPALVILLGAIGLSAILSWLDYVLFPVLVLSIAITIYAFIRHQREAAAGRREP